MKRIVVDTNAYTRLLAGDEKVLDAITTAEPVYMPIFVRGGLEAGKVVSVLSRTAGWMVY